MRRRQIYALQATQSCPPDDIIPDSAWEKNIPNSSTTNVENACPKCGRVLTRGRYAHVKWCKGGA